MATSAAPAHARHRPTIRSNFLRWRRRQATGSVMTRTRLYFFLGSWSMPRQRFPLGFARLPGRTVGMVESETDVMSTIARRPDPDSVQAEFREMVIGRG